MLDKIELYLKNKKAYTKEDIEVTIPTIFGIGRSNVFQKVDDCCNKDYWVKSLTKFYHYSYIYNRNRVNNHNLGLWYNISDSCGIRPILKSNNIKKLIKNCNNSMDGGIQVVEYGEFPDLFEETKISDISLLEPTHNGYVLPSEDFLENLDVLLEYDYQGQKVVKKGDSYHPVKPIEWYVDEENNMLISKKVLFLLSINALNKNYGDDSQASLLYDYLNDIFLNQLIDNPKQLKQALANQSYHIKVDSLTIPKDATAELKSRIENLLRRRQELLDQSECLDNELENNTKQKTIRM